MTVDRFAQWDAAFVLGALDDEDATQFRAHLKTCPSCRSRVAEATQTLHLLGDAAAQPAIADAAVPQTLLPGLLARARVERSRRRWLIASLAGAAAACLVALLVVVWPSSPAPPPTRPAAVKMVALVDTPVQATAELRSRAWGTEIDVHCRYDHLPPRVVPYDLRVIDVDDQPYDLGSWSLVPGRTVSFVGGTEVRRERIAKVQITLPDGTPVLQLAF